jgi:hypothetical protein
MQKYGAIKAKQQCENESMTYNLNHKKIECSNVGHCSLEKTQQ